MASEPTKAHTCWVEVDLRAIVHNLQQVRRLVGPSVKIMAVVKADAYGHGALKVAKAIVEAGAEYLGVTRLEEGLALRKAGIATPILVFSPLLSDQVEAAVANGLDQTVCALDSLESISAAVERAGKKARVHVKIDTGMGRLGVIPDECPDFLAALVEVRGIEIAGVYTHFANAGAKNLSGVRQQNLRFSELLARLAACGLPIGLRHAANSAAILNLPDSHYDMVRPGTVLYGQFPTPYVERKIELRDTWRLKTRIVALRRLPTGAKVGYGSEFAAKRPTIAAILPIGYADGFTIVPESVARRASSRLRFVAGKLLGMPGGPRVTVRGRRAPIIGRVSMQMCTVDVRDIPGVQLGDEVIIPARRTTTSCRIPRVYVPRDT